MTTDTPTREELRFYALASGPDGLARFKLPTTFQLEDRTRYYQLYVEARLERMAYKALWRSAHLDMCHGRVQQSKMAKHVLLAKFVIDM